MLTFLTGSAVPRLVWNRFTGQANIRSHVWPFCYFTVPSRQFRRAVTPPRSSHYPRESERRKNGAAAHEFPRSFVPDIVFRTTPLHAYSKALRTSHERVAMMSDCQTPSYMVLSVSDVPGYFVLVTWPDNFETQVHRVCAGRRRSCVDSGDRSKMAGVGTATYST